LQALDRILREQYKLVQVRSVVLSKPQAERYVELSGAKAGVVDALCDGRAPAIVLALERTNAVTQFRMLLAGKGRSEVSPASLLHSACSSGVCS